MINNRVGQQLGNYRLVTLLGVGGFAEVYLGEHIHLGTQAAIKVLSAQLIGQDEQKFRDEARTLVKLAHPHIVKVLDFGVDGTTPYLVMEYAPNGNLRLRHPRGSLLSLGDVVSYVQQIAQALQHAHDMRLIHRDVKPENMLLGAQYDILLSDFGISVMAHSTQSQQTQYPMGTIDYIAPEQINGYPVVASDQYALAVIVYEWLTGTLPFDGTPSEKVSKRLAGVAPASLYARNVRIPPSVEPIVFKALRRDPQDRFAHVQDFATALEYASKAAQPLNLSSPTGNGPASPMSQTLQGVAPTSSTSTFASTGTTRAIFQGHTGPVNAVAWSSDSMRVASASEDGTIQVWSAATGQIRVLKGKGIFSHDETLIYQHASAVRAMSWSPQEEGYLAFSSTDRTILVWSPVTNRLAGNTRHTGVVTAVAWSLPNAHYLASGNSDGEVQLWDWQRRKDDGRMPPANRDDRRFGHGHKDHYQHEERVTAVAWSLDGRYIASADSTDMVRIYAVKIVHEQGVHKDRNGNTQSFTETFVSLEHRLNYYGYHQGEVTSLAWSPDGQYIASGGVDGTVQVWESSTGLRPFIYNRHRGPVRTVAWSRDGKLVVSGSDDGTVQVWHAAGTVCTYTGHSGGVRGVAWSPDGRCIASGSIDGTAHVWWAP